MLIPELLDKARAARTDLDEADRRALLTRAEYHTAIRRLHLAGGRSASSYARPFAECARAITDLVRYISFLAGADHTCTQILHADRGICGKFTGTPIAEVPASVCIRLPDKHEQTPAAPANQNVAHCHFRRSTPYR